MLVTHLSLKELRSSLFAGSIRVGLVGNYVAISCVRFLSN